MQKSSRGQPTISGLYKAQEQIGRMLYYGEVKPSLLKNILFEIKEYAKGVEYALYEERKGIIVTTIPDGHKYELERKLDTIFSSSPRNMVGYNGKIRYKCIKLLPDNDSYLYLEYESSTEAEHKNTDILYQLLAVAVRLYELNQTSKSIAMEDSIPGVKRRHAFMEVLEKETEKQSENPKYSINLACIRIKSLSEANQTKSIKYMDKYMQFLVKNMKDVFQANVYRLSSGSFAVFTDRDFKECGILLQDILDECKEYEPMVSNTGVVLCCCDEPEKTVYLAEKHLKDANEDTIRVVRTSPDVTEDEAFEKVYDLMLV